MCVHRVCACIVCVHVKKEKKLHFVAQADSRSKFCQFAIIYVFAAKAGSRTIQEEQKEATQAAVHGAGLLTFPKYSFHQMIPP